MAFREVTMIEVEEAQRLWLRGVAKKRIAKQLGLDPKTVRHYCEVAEAHGVEAAAGEASLTDERVLAVLAELTSMPGRRCGDAWARCVELRGDIEKHLAEGIKPTKVRKLLLRAGDDIPYTTLHRFAVSELAFGRRRATVAIADGEPGKELQVDVGWVTSVIDERGRRRVTEA